MKTTLIIGIPAIFAIGYLIYVICKFIKAINDSDWQDHSFIEFDEEDIFYGDEKEY